MYTHWVYFTTVEVTFDNYQGNWSFEINTSIRKRQTCTCQSKKLELEGNQNLWKVFAITGFGIHDSRQPEF